MNDTNQDQNSPQPQSDEPQSAVSVPGYIAEAVTLSDVGNDRIGIHFHVPEQLNPLQNRTYSLDRTLAEDLYKKLGSVLDS